MNKILLIRFEEIFLKGLNRPIFEKQLINNIKKAIKDYKNIKIMRTYNRIFAVPTEESVDINIAINKITKVFGVASVSPVIKIKSDFEEIVKTATELAKDKYDSNTNRTFKIETKRADKNFPHKSPYISREVGGKCLEAESRLKVDVKTPNFIINIEIREDYSYIFTDKIMGAGGLPVGSGGRAALLLSGGIDSPVAGWMISKRGVQIDAIYFHSPPYTSERAKEKVVNLAKIIAEYCINIRLHVVNFTEIQMGIKEKCPLEYITIIMRRYMMKIAERLALSNNCKALVTGECIGQVASQTIESLHVTNSAVSIPVFRPLIGMDKREVIHISKKINTYETSILPFEDCCTIFVPKHPKTRPVLEDTIKYENIIDMENLINRAIENTEVINISF